MINIRLKPWDIEDAHLLAKHINNIHIWNNVRDSLPFPYTEEDAVFYINMVIKKGIPRTDFAIEADGVLAGGIGLIPGEDVERVSAEVGYWVGEPYWGKGIATEAVKQITTYAFSELSLTRLYAGVYEYNKASMRVLQKAGYTQEAILRKAVIKNGNIIDFHQYSIIRG